MITKPTPSFPEYIQREAIPQLRFSYEDVLPLSAQRKRRLQDLERAVQLGQGYEGKVKVIFKTVSGKPKRVYASVEGFNTQIVHFAGQASLPVRAILRIEFF